MKAETLTHLERRKIEARVLIPMVQAFQHALGAEQANAIAQQVFLGWARADGARWAERFGTDLDALEKLWAIWASGGSLEIEERRRTDEALSFNVTRCCYAEFFQSLGLADLGFMFCCNRDFAIVEGLGSGLSMTRTQTLMQGADHCNFRYERKKVTCRILEGWWQAPETLPDGD